MALMLFRKYGDRGLVEEDIDSEKRREAEHCIWTGPTKALPLLRTNGRLDNHRRVVRQVLLTVIGAELPSHLRSFVAREMSLDVKALREYSDVLDDLSGEIVSRGLRRTVQNGVRGFGAKRRSMISTSRRRESVVGCNQCAKCEQKGSCSKPSRSYRGAFALL